MGVWNRNILLGVLGIGSATGASAYEIMSRISDAIASKPIEVRFLIMPGVTPENKARTLAETWRAYQVWEAIPTCRLRFRA